MASLLPNERLRSAVAERVGRHLGRAWRPVRVQDKSESASHAAAILSDGTYAVFVKLATSATARDQFEREAAGLRFLTRRSGVLTPTVIGIAEGEGAVALIMEAVRTVERGPREWRQMGRALARIHAVQADRFGFHAYNYWGDFRQENSPAADWAEFFWTNRIAPRLAAAVDSGHLPVGLAVQVEGLHARLPALCGNRVTPSLLHGDAHQNNFLCTPNGPALIDPAICFGHPEADLAYVDFFAPVSELLFDGYRELAAIEHGFAERRELWLIPARLAMIEVLGPRHVPRLVTALRSLV